MLSALVAEKLSLDVPIGSDPPLVLGRSVRGMTDIDLRVQAVDFALRLGLSYSSADSLIGAASLIEDYLADGDTAGSNALVMVRVGLIARQDGEGSPREGSYPVSQLHDDEQISYTLAGRDAKGYDVTGEAFSASVDNGDVVKVTQDGDTFTVVANAPGSAVVTFSDDASGLSVTQSVDVVPGNIATIQVQAGDIQPQPAAPVETSTDSTAPVADAPVDAPATDDSAPAVDAPVADAPVEDAPVADAPVADAPTSDATEADATPAENQVAPAQDSDAATGQNDDVTLDETGTPATADTTPTEAPTVDSPAADAAPADAAPAEGDEEDPATSVS